MKLIIQIPCYNEEQTLGATLAALPGEVEGFDQVEVLVVDDSSSDRTAEVARANGARHIVGFSRNQGLARGFVAGLDAALKLGADVIVNTDADNQYVADDIPKLVAPILEGKADIVVGARPIKEAAHFSTTRKILQKLGSWMVRLVSRTDIQDATSGFRAISRDAALRLNVFNNYTYTLETIIQAGRKNMAITSVPIRVNPTSRPSRLITSVPSYIWKSILTIIRIFVVYKPFAFFMTVGALLFTMGVLLGVRFLYFFFTGQGAGHMQSLILAGVLLGMGFQTILVAFLADLISVNRNLLEELQYKLRKGSGTKT